MIILFPSARKGSIVREARKRASTNNLWKPEERFLRVSKLIARPARIVGCKEAWSAFNWFLGKNDLQIALYDPTTGGCRDGLHPERVNENQGAESTLAFLMALVEMRLLGEVNHPRSDVIYSSPATKILRRKRTVKCFA